ncbi:MAG: hypothetical protein M3134_00870 [Actinomycetota bacterium]|nr:hypothetical protein [Actinomycetota bacterium]
MTKARFVPAAAALVAAVTAGTIWKSDLAQGNPPGYAFSDIRVEQATDPATGLPDPHHARLSFDFSWTTQQFPGTRRCVWNVYDAKGDVVGTRTDMMTAQAQSADDVTSLIDVSGPPAHATVDCEPGRFDDPSGRYSLTDVSARPSQGPGVTVTFDASWAGTGEPTPQECTVVLKGADGQRIARRLSFASPQRTLTDVESHVDVPERAAGREYSVVEMQCAASGDPE